MTENRMAVFRNSTFFLQDDGNPFTGVARYTSSPLLSGYTSEANLGAIREGISISARTLGSGAVIRFVDNPNFRGVFRGTQRLFLNSVFFGGIIRSTPVGDSR